VTHHHFDARLGVGAAPQTANATSVQAPKTIQEKFTRDTFLAAEVMVQAADAAVGSTPDVVNCGRVETLVGETLKRGGQDLRTPDHGCGPDSPTSRHSTTSTSRAVPVPTIDLKLELCSSKK